jgi:hypothetical protein
MEMKRVTKEFHEIKRYDSQVKFFFPHLSAYELFTVFFTSQDVFTMQGQSRSILGK